MQPPDEAYLQIVYGQWVYIIYFPAHCLGVTNMSPSDKLSPNTKIYRQHWHMGQKHYRLVQNYHQTEGIIIMAPSLAGSGSWSRMTRCMTTLELGVSCKATQNSLLVTLMYRTFLLRTLNSYGVNEQPVNKKFQTPQYAIVY